MNSVRTLLPAWSRPNQRLSTDCGSCRAASPNVVHGLPPRPTAAHIIEQFTAAGDGVPSCTSIRFCWRGCSSPSPISFHIIFPTFTIGIAIYLATLEVLWGWTGAERYKRLAAFWTKIFAVSFAMGVVSGVVLSYQFGTNWSRFSAVAGNVVGPLLGYEVLTAFFLEASFLGVLLFGGERVPRWLHVFSGCDGRASAPRCRRSGFSRPIAGCRRRPATRWKTASPIRRTGGRSSSIRAFPIGSRTCSMPRCSPAASSASRSARAICWPVAMSRKRAPCCAWRSG